MLATLAGLAAPALGADLEGSADHPAIQRYPGAEIVRYQQEDFTDTRLFVEPASAYGGLQKNLDHTRALEGRVTRIAYRMPAERSTLEILRNYEQALAEAGFETLFTCANEACGGRNFNHAAIPYATEFAENYRDQRYLAAHLARPEEGDLYAALYVVRNTAGGGADKDRVFGHLEVVELTPMDSGLVTVDAAAMAEGLEAEGRIALYNIFFGFDSAELQPDSDPALAEIARLLAGKPDLEVLVVGHTDAEGALDYNLELSRKRAAAVVEALVGGHGVAPERLTPAGVGFLAPVATNRTEQGRALNRRVELVDYR
jgi:outer membrane protein OmpA-like peptidoglycan-associated protein